MHCTQGKFSVKFCFIFVVLSLRFGGFDCFCRNNCDYTLVTRPVGIKNQRKLYYLWLFLWKCSLAFFFAFLRAFLRSVSPRNCRCRCTCCCHWGLCLHKTFGFARRKPIQHNYKASREATQAEPQTKPPT